MISGIFGGRPRKSSVVAEISLPVNSPLSLRGQPNRQLGALVYRRSATRRYPHAQLVDEVRSRLGRLLSHPVHMLVCTEPGPSAFTVIPLSASSCANTSVSRTTAALLEQ